jgi:hypothetical protein
MAMEILFRLCQAIKNYLIDNLKFWSNKFNTKKKKRITISSECSRWYFSITWVGQAPSVIPSENFYNLKKNYFHKI